MSTRRPKSQADSEESKGLSNRAKKVLLALAGTGLTAAVLGVLLPEPPDAGFGRKLEAVRASADRTLVPGSTSTPGGPGAPISTNSSPSEDPTGEQGGAFGGDQAHRNPVSGSHNASSGGSSTSEPQSPSGAVGGSQGVNGPSEGQNGLRSPQNGPSSSPEETEPQLSGPDEILQRINDLLDNNTVNAEQLGQLLTQLNLSQLEAHHTNGVMRVAGRLLRLLTDPQLDVSVRTALGLKLHSFIGRHRYEPVPNTNPVQWRPVVPNPATVLTIQDYHRLEEELRLQDQSLLEERYAADWQTYLTELGQATPAQLQILVLRRAGTLLSMMGTPAVQRRPNFSSELQQMFSAVVRVERQLEAAVSQIPSYLLKDEQGNDLPNGTVRHRDNVRSLRQQLQQLYPTLIAPSEETE